MRNRLIGITIVIVIILSIVGYVKTKERHRRAIYEARHQKQQEQIKLINKRVERFVRDYKANNTWIPEFSGKAGALGFLYTIELERLWIRNGPIVFYGTILDIKTLDQDYYEINIGHTAYDYLIPMPNKLVSRANFELSLKAKKQIVDEFLSNHSEKITAGVLLRPVALAAHIDKIKSEKQTSFSYGSMYVDPDAEKEIEFFTHEIKTGVGKLLDIIYIGDVLQ
ncbi:hypothetical protein ACFL6U_07000 [Planctomycetota bacterium]